MWCNVSQSPSVRYSSVVMPSPAPDTGHCLPRSWPLRWAPAWVRALPVPAPASPVCCLARGYIPTLRAADHPSSLLPTMIWQARCQRLWLDRKIKLNNGYVYDWYQLYLTTLFHSKFTHLSWPAPCPWARLLTLITLCPRDRALSLSLVPACLAWPAGPVCPRPARPRLTLTLFYQTLWMHVSEFLWVNTAVRLLQVRAPGTLKTTVRKHREEGKLGEKSRKVVKIFCKTDVI